MLEWTHVERILADVVAIRPVYTDTGKATEVLTRTGHRYLDRRDVRSVKKAMFRSCFIDPRAQGEMVRSLLDRDLALPFFLEGNRVFIALKMRQPQVQSDPAYGYVELSSIEQLEPTPDNRCLVTLKNGVTLDLISTHETAIRSREAGYKLQAALQQQPDPDHDLEAMVLRSAAALLQMMRQMHKALEDIAKKLGG